MSEETCPDCGLPRWTDSGSKQEFGTCMAHLDQTEPEEIIACRDRELAKLRPTPERFYRWWSGLTNSERVSCWYDLDAMAHPEVVSALKAELSAATARASELETELSEARDVLRHALSDFFEEEDGWIERASALCGDERLSRLQRAAKVEEVLQAALNQKTEQLIKVDQNLTELVTKRDAELSALGERVARAERENEAWRVLAGVRALQHRGDDGYWFEVFGKPATIESHPTQQAAALASAVKLGLMRDETKGKTDG